jgi:hypothetical protein
MDMYPQAEQIYYTRNTYRVLQFFSRTARMPFCLKIEPSVLSFLIKQSLSKPFKSLKLIHGSGCLGSMHTTEKSTLEGGCDVISADFHHVGDTGEELCVDREAAVEGIARVGNKARCNVFFGA